MSDVPGRGVGDARSSASPDPLTAAPGARGVSTPPGLGFRGSGVEGLGV